MAFAVTLLAAPRLFAQQDDSDATREVVVHGQRKPLHGARDESVSSSRIPRERLTRPGADASTVLAETPGAQLTRSGSGAELSTLSLRATSSAQTPVFLGGVRLNDDLTGTADVSRVPLWMLDRIEVYRGGAPTALSQWGIGGAVVFEPRVPRFSGLHAGGAVGSFGMRSTSVGASARGADGSASLGLRLAAADNDFSYLDDGGTAFDGSDDRVRVRHNADHRETDVWSLGEWRLGRVRVQSTLNAFDREQGAAGIALIPAERARSHTRRLLLGTEALVPCARAARCELSFATDALWTSHAVSDPDRELGLGASYTRLVGIRLGQSARLLGELGPIVAVAGLRAEHSALQSDVGNASRALRRSARSSGEVRAALTEQLTLVVAGAAEMHSTRGTDGREHAALSPFARGAFLLSLLRELTLRASATWAERPPTLGELYGVSAVSLGNSELQAERALSAELGVSTRARGVAGEFEADLAGFCRDTNELIAFRRSGFGVLRPFNLGSTRVLGAELSARADLVQHLELDAAVTAMEPRDISADRTTTNDLLPFQSRLTSYGRVGGYVAFERGAVSRTSLGMSLRTRSSRVADPAGLIVLPGSEIVSADAAIALLDQHLRLRAAAENLFDQRELDLLGFPLPGRAVFVGAELALALR
ncbi:MAG: TonB-dependent receptor [Polyangiaceae bacterium]